MLTLFHVFTDLVKDTLIELCGNSYEYSPICLWIGKAEVPWRPINGHI